MCAHRAHRAHSHTCSLSKINWIACVKIVVCKMWNSVISIVFILVCLLACLLACDLFVFFSQMHEWEHVDIWHMCECVESLPKVQTKISLMCWYSCTFCFTRTIPIAVAGILWIGCSTMNRWQWIVADAGKTEAFIKACTCTFAGCCCRCCCCCPGGRAFSLSIQFFIWCSR